MKYYKIVNPKGHHGMVYKEGLNTDILPFRPYGNCEPGGIYFSREDILAYLNYGTELYEVEPIGEVYENPGIQKKWKAHEVKLKYVGKVVDNIQMLIDEGAGAHVDNNYALFWASRNGHIEIVKILLKNDVDIHGHNDYAIRSASQNGHFELVELLLENGADIHAGNDYALRWASEKGYLKVVKLLLENGADVHAHNDYALRWASMNNHTEVVELLKTYMKK